MNQRKFVSVLASVTLILAGVTLTPLTAHAISVGGGVWTYDANPKTVWSQYEHSSKWHMSWVKNNVQRRDTPALKPGDTAYTSLQASLGGNKAGWGIY